MGSKNKNKNKVAAENWIVDFLRFLKAPKHKAKIMRIYAVLITSIVAASCNFIISFLNRSPKPFCDNNLEFDDSVLLSDSCEPCPSNGRCYNGQLECIQGYRNYGILCIEDGDINETANKFSELAKSHLCEAHARYKCDGTGTIWVSVLSEDEMKSMFDNSGLVQISTMDDTKYLYVKERTMEGTSKLFDVRTSIDGYAFRFPISHIRLCFGNQISAIALILVLEIRALP